MRIIADLHLHSRFSRATSPKLNPPFLERWARIKGINLVGTGDCTHPRWLAELREQLEEQEAGLYVLKKKVRRDFDAGPALAEGLPNPGRSGPEGGPRFVLTGEISTIYKRGDKVRKVHHLVLLPDFKAAASFQTRLEQVGNIVSDGRPIIGIDSRDLLSLLLETDERAILVPAHIWTPWFSALGAKSGFDSIEECYRDLTDRIPAIETGLSSNPPMNWALSSLDRFSIISNSDAHSPDKLGRESTVFEMPLSYPGLADALWQRGGAARIIETIEFFPQEGKYHYDGHRKCGYYCSSGEAATENCPVCGKPMTRGVMGRVLELADRPVDESAPCPPGSGKTKQRPYRSLIPLRELLGELLEIGAASKKTMAAYTALIEQGGSEFSLLMDRTPGELGGLSCPGLPGELLAAAITRMRSGQVFIEPGYDGEYGVIRVFPRGEKIPTGREGALFADIPRQRAGTGKRPAPAAGKKRSQGRKAAGSGETGDAAEKDFIPDGEQEKVIAYGGSHALIIAGPGTGKTAVLAARIARMVREGTDPASILALSFTVKAAAELRDRIAKMAGPEAVEKITAATFHSLGASILREQPESARVPQNFRILDDPQRNALLEELCGERPKNRRLTAQALGNYIEGRKRFLLLPGEDTPRLDPGMAWAEDLGLPEGDPEKEELYGLYRTRLRFGGILDFDDLVAGPVRLFIARQEIRSRYQGRYRYIFADEYQDINFAQYALLRLLAPHTSPEGGSLWVIGDPNQAIYAFRGSDKRFIDRFLADYPEAARFRLARSFRCAGPIIAAAGRLVDDRLGGTEKPVSLFRSAYPTEKSEAEGIARSISRLIGGTTFFALDSQVADGLSAAPGSPDHAEQSAGPGDCAILLRSISLAPPLVKALRDHGIPFELTGEIPWWEEEPAKSLLDLLWSLRGPPDALGEAAGEKGPPDQALTDGAPSRGFSITGKSPAEALRAAWDFMRQNSALPTAKGTGDSLERLFNLAALYEDLPSFLDILAVSGPGGVREFKSEGVRIMTIHASKGLEFDHVFVAALEEGLLPFTLFDRPPGKTQTPLAEEIENSRLEEERRLLYVAMTRARQGLYLSWAGQRNYRNRKLQGGPSRFLEALEEMVPLLGETRTRKREPQLRLF
ncbi:UvrD-helicase domain-containing protein [Treponema sp. TIM-1]|uniref:UvrD-helicase domain-containing protein n=1 Tax=Treponema sp. TIM-1 TaxID=2898417 RepID=UPI00397F3399